MHVILRRAARPELAQVGWKTLNAVSLLDVLRRNGRRSSSDGSRRGGGHLGVRNVRRRLDGPVWVLEDRHLPHLIRRQTQSAIVRSRAGGENGRTCLFPLTFSTIANVKTPAKATKTRSQVM